MEINSIPPFIEYYKRIRFRTTEVIALIPEEKIEWTYAAGKFTFGDIIRHIAAIERYMYAENMMGKPSAYPGCGIALASGHHETIAFMSRLHLESLAIFASLSPANLQEKCVTPGVH
ncbi:MAG TPA: DinB family protein [Cyclobacteriaceae bacterium]|nr:DinB family protein [Cyclobacteriaceae bacterium]